jgi:hypothetical protein
MYSVQELRAYADEHLDWARTARTDRERRIFLQMAWAWLEIAIRLEGVSQTTAEPALAMSNETFRPCQNKSSSDLPVPFSNGAWDFPGSFRSG